MPTPLRQKRVAERIQIEISELIQREMKDPRLALVTITRVRIDRELEHANVFVSTVGDAARQKEVLSVLDGARGFIRREIARRVQLRRTPEIHFLWDPAPEKTEHIEQLLDQIKAASPPPASPDENENPKTDEPDDQKD